MAAADKIAAGIGGPAPSKVDYIGVPKDYFALRPAGPWKTGYVPSPAAPAPGPWATGYVPVGTPGPPSGVPARYKEGDELEIGYQGPEVIAQHQKALVRAGLLTGSYRFGVWDDKSIQAYRTAMATANVAGVDVQEAIRMYADAPKKPGAPEPRAPLVKKIPSSADLRDTFKTVAQSTIGRYADPALIERMVRGYQQAVSAEQQAEYDLEPMGGPGGTVTQAPSADAYARQQITAANPMEEATHRGLGIAERFMQVFQQAPTGG